MARANPDPGRITAALWYFVVECLDLAPGSQYGGTFTDKPGYHNTRNNLLNQGRTGDYSVRLAADKAGPGDKTAAFDWTFPDAQAGRYGTIVTFGARVKNAFHARDPRLRGWREVLIQADFDGSAEGFDFTSWSERTPDSSHLWHGHFSVLRQYLNDVSVMNGMLSILAGEPLATWQAGQSRYGGTAPLIDKGVERMFVAVLREPGKGERWVWSNGQTFTEIREGWLLEERKKIAAKVAEHTSAGSFYAEVGVPFAETIPKATQVEVSAEMMEVLGSMLLNSVTPALRSIVRAELDGTRLAAADS